MSKTEKLAAARSKIRHRYVTEHTLTIPCPRHDAVGATVDVTITTSVHEDGWALKEVPKGCTCEDHTFTMGERATMTLAIDEVLGNTKSSQEQDLTDHGVDTSYNDMLRDAGRRTIRE